MHDLARLMAERIAIGLKRRTVTNAARWAENYRVMGAPFPGPWNWTHHPWLYPMHTRDYRVAVGQKSAQMGFTEYALNKTFSSMDIQGVSVLYVLPSNDDASDFSSARFDKALELSDYLSKFFSEVKNVGHKRAGSASLYVRGSRSRSKLKSVDTALLIFDELDEMTQENVILARERQSGQRIDTQQQLYISTPTIENFGINALFKESTQEYFFFKCPRCSRLTELVFPDCIVITAENIIDPRLKDTHYICKECKGVLNQETKAEWLKPVELGGTARFVPSYSDREKVGWSVNQMYSCTIAPATFAESYLLGQRDPTFETEFFNSKLGKTHAVKGSKIDDEDITRCIGSHQRSKTRPKNSLRTIGIDVGKVCHWEVNEWYFEGEGYPAAMLNDYAEPVLIDHGTTSGSELDINELDDLIRKFGIDGGVIDAEPERRMAYQLATRFWGKIYLCDFMFSQAGRAIGIAEEEATLKVNRTVWMDLALSRFRMKRIVLPTNIDQEYRTHIKEPQRVYKRDRFGNNQGFYESVNADHYALSRVYAEIALLVASANKQNQTIRDLF